MRPLPVCDRCGTIGAHAPRKCAQFLAERQLEFEVYVEHGPPPEWSLRQEWVARGSPVTSEEERQRGGG